MKNTATLAFEMLEQEIELLNSEEMDGFVGGSNYTFGSIEIYEDQYGHTMISFDGGANYSNLAPGEVTVYGTTKYEQISEALSWALDATAINVFMAQVLAGVQSGDIINGLDEVRC